MGIFQQLCAMLDDGDPNADIGCILDSAVSPSFRIQEVDFAPSKFKLIRDTSKDFTTAGLLLGGQLDGGEIEYYYDKLVEKGIDYSDHVLKRLETRGIIGQFLPDLSIVSREGLVKFDQMNAGQRLRGLMDRYDMKIPVTGWNFASVTEDPAVNYDYKRSGKHDRTGIVRYTVQGKDYPVNYMNARSVYNGVEALVKAVNRYYCFEKYRYYPRHEWAEPLTYIIMYNYNVVVGDGKIYFIRKKFIGATDLSIQRFFNHTSAIICVFESLLLDGNYLVNKALFTEDLYSLIYCSLLDSGASANTFLEDAVTSLCKLYGAISIDVVKEFDLTRITLCDVYNFRMQRNYLLELSDCVRDVIFQGKWKKIVNSTINVPVINTTFNDDFASIVIGYLLGIWKLDDVPRIHVSGFVERTFLAHLDLIATKSGDEEFRKWYFSRNRTYFITCAKVMDGVWKEAQKVDSLGIDGNCDPVIRLYINTGRIYRFDDTDKDDLNDFLFLKNNVRGLYLSNIGDEGLMNLVMCRSYYGERGIGFAFKKGEKVIFACSRSIVYRNTLGIDISSVYSVITGLPFLDSFYCIVDSYRDGGGTNDPYSLGGVSAWSSQNDKAVKSRGKNKKFRNKSCYY